MYFLCYFHSSVPSALDISKYLEWHKVMFGYCSSFTTLIVSLVSLTFEWYQTKIVWIEYPDIAHVNPKHATMIKTLTAILSNLLYQGNPWSVVISVHRLNQSRQIAFEKLISIKWHFLWHSIYNIAFISNLPILPNLGFSFDSAVPTFLVVIITSEMANWWPFFLSFSKPTN